MTTSKRAPERRIRTLANYARGVLRTNVASLRPLVSRPEVSIVVPVFNAQSHLASCLDSIRAQPFRRFEVICVDDGSTDGSGAVLDAACRRDSRIRVIRHRANLGAAAARNTGLMRARGRYVRFLDADDLLPPDSTALLHARALETGSSIVGGSISLFSGDDPSAPFLDECMPDRFSTTLARETSLWIPWWSPAYLYSRRFLVEHTITFPPLVAGEDPVFQARALCAAKSISLIPDRVYSYRRYEKEGGSAARSERHLTDWLCHAMMVKSMFLACHPPAWRSGYGPFLRSNTMRYWLDSTERSRDEPATWDWASALFASADWPSEDLESWWPRDWVTRIAPHTVHAE